MPHGLRYLIGLGGSQEIDSPNFINKNMKNFKRILSETIRKTGDDYAIYSKKGKKLGKYDSKEAAEKRLKQIEWFKRHRNY